LKGNIMNTVWEITQCEHEVATGFITVAHWTATAVDGEYSASIYATCSWAPGAPTIPYNQVTEQEVLDWCWASGVDKDATEAALAQQIEAQKNPVTSTGLPWAA
jgi:hypothetical protein